MKITYINHSGFLIETRDCYYIFDYYKGELPYLDKEKEVIIRILRENNGNKTKSALALGISRRSLHRKIQKY